MRCFWRGCQLQEGGVVWVERVEAGRGVGKGLVVRDILEREEIPLRREVKIERIPESTERGGDREIFEGEA